MNVSLFPLRSVIYAIDLGPKYSMEQEREESMFGLSSRVMPQQRDVGVRPELLQYWVRISGLRRSLNYDIFMEWNKLPKLLSFNNKNNLQHLQGPHFLLVQSRPDNLFLAGASRS